MQMLYATNFNKLFGSYLGHQVPPKQFRVREGKGREGARAEKMQKGVQSIPNCQRSSEKNGFQLVGMGFSMFQ